MTNKVGGNNVIDIFGTTAATLADNTKNQGDVLRDMFTFITTGQRPTAISNDYMKIKDVNITIGTKAQSDLAYKYGAAARTATATRNTGRNR